MKPEERYELLLLRKERLQGVREPLFIDPKTETDKIHFLRDVVGQPYPVYWYYQNVKRSERIFRKSYAQWLANFMDQHDRWEKAQQELKKIEWELRRLEYQSTHSFWVDVD